jgi:hypothetical protein
MSVLPRMLYPAFPLFTRGTWLDFSNPITQFPPVLTPGIFLSLKNGYTKSGVYEQRRDQSNKMILMNELRYSMTDLNSY